MKRGWIALVVFGAALCLFLGTPALSGQVEGLVKAFEKLPPEVLQEVLEDLGVSTIPAPVPKTGSTFDDTVLGDDGELQMGVTWPDPRFTDHDNGTVTDNLTGLVWTKDAYISGTPHWGDACAACNGLADDGVDLTDGSQAGNWRLPNVRELQSLIDYGNNFPALPENHPFVNVVTSNYWSSTTVGHPDLTDCAFHVDFQIGVVDFSTSGKAGSEYAVWCVRDAN